MPNKLKKNFLKGVPHTISLTKWTVLKLKKEPTEIIKPLDRPIEKTEIKHFINGLEQRHTYAIEKDN